MKISSSFQSPNNYQPSVFVVMKELSFKVQEKISQIKKKINFILIQTSKFKIFSLVMGAVINYLTTLISS